MTLTPAQKFNRFPGPVRKLGLPKGSDVSWWTLPEYQDRAVFQVKAFELAPNMQKPGMVMSTRADGVAE